MKDIVNEIVLLLFLNVLRILKKSLGRFVHWLVGEYFFKKNESSKILVVFDKMIINTIFYLRLTAFQSGD